MKKMIAVLAASTMTLASTAFALTAMEDAIQRKICLVPPVSAEYQADGRLRVVCPAGQVNPAYAGSVVQAGVLAGTGLGAGAAGALAAGAALLLVVAGDNGTGTTTTTTIPGS